MTVTSSVQIANAAVSNLQGYFETVLPILIPVVIAVTVVFSAIALLKGLWHRRV